MTIDLTTLAKVRAIGTWDAGDTTDDALLTRLITAYSYEFERYLDRHTEQQAYTEVYRLPQGEKVVSLLGAPATVVTTVKYTADKDWANATALTETDDFLVDLDDATIRLTYDTTHAPGFVQVVYTGGMATTEPNFTTAFPAIAEACAGQVFYHWQRRRTPDGNVTVGGGSTSFDGQLKLLGRVKDVLERYRRRYL